MMTWHKIALYGILLALSGCAVHFSPAELAEMSDDDLSRYIRVGRFHGPTHAYGGANLELFLSELLSRHPNWPEETKADIREGKIAIGMTHAQVSASWGPPDRENATITAAGKSEQWVYSDTYVYFENGRVTSMQSSSSN